MMPPREENETTTSTDVPSSSRTMIRADSIESTPLVFKHISFEDGRSPKGGKRSPGGRTKSEDDQIKSKKQAIASILMTIVTIFLVVYYFSSWDSNDMNENQSSSSEINHEKFTKYPNGSYELVDRQVGEKFFDSYKFWDGPDSPGSAGYNVYVGKERALKLGLVNVTYDETQDESYIFMSSAPTEKGPRESIRIEGTKRYNHGLFMVDLMHMPAGCGQWPAFWLTDDDEGQWPAHGEIDIVEGVNYQSVAKTALHTSGSCSMWQQVPPYAKTGQWDRADGLFDRFTGLPQNDSMLPADNCYVKAPHQWPNQGCVLISDQNDTIGAGLNEKQGGVYVLEWDPENGYIRSWVFPREQGIPANIVEAIQTSENPEHERTSPDPNDDSWGLPYAYFAIGEHSDCSADHFQNMRLIFNLAFCGTVAGNRYFNDCPNIVEQFPPAPEIQYDPIAACNAYIQSNPDELEEAYWKIKGVYVYQHS